MDTDFIEKMEIGSAPLSRAIESAVKLLRPEQHSRLPSLSGLLGISLGLGGRGEGIAFS